MRSGAFRGRSIRWSFFGESAKRDVEDGRRGRVGNCIGLVV